MIGFNQMPPLVEEVEDVTNLTLTILGSVDGSELQGLLGYSRAGGVIDMIVSPCIPLAFGVESDGR